MLNQPIHDNILSFSLPQLAEMINHEIKQAGSQRNSVWNEARVELLWDSILRHFPIGSLLFGLAHENDLPEVGVRDLQYSRSSRGQETREASHDVQFIVIDGQQRLDSIALGWQDQNPGARLWLDLAEPAAPEQRPFEFHLCTLDNPWGAGSNIDTRRRALEKIGLTEFDLPGPELSATWPLRARCPVPFAVLIHMLQEGNGQADPTQAELLALAPADRRATLRSDLPEALQAIRQIVISGDYRVPVVLANGLDKRKLGQIFERLNTQGVVPNQAELFYSALKLRWPPANNLISSMANDPATGKFLSPLELVHLAERSVSPEVTELKTDRFDRFVEKRLPELQELLGFGQNSPGDTSLFHQCLLWARQALEFNGQPGDPGLPPPLLLQLKGRIWQTLVFWIARHPGPVKPRDRLEMLRFCLFALLYLDPGSKNSAFLIAPFGDEDAQGEWDLGKCDHFPGLDIYLRWRKAAYQDGSRLELLTPEAYQAHLAMSGERPTNFELYNERGLLMWGQREFFHRWFAPYAGELYWRMAEKPYDLDHILPASYLTFSGPIPIAQFCHPKIEERYIRQQVLNLSGNLRYWPSVLEPEYKDLNLDKKLLLGPASNPTHAALERFGMDTVGDVRRASLIEEDDLAEWEAAANIGKWTKNWKDLARFHAFHQAVERRRVRLYAGLYHQLDFEKWV